MSILKKGELCPACQNGKLDKIIKDIVLTYKKKQKVLKSKKVFKCELCDFEGLTKKSSRDIEKGLTDFRRDVDGLLSSDQLKQIRQRLGLNKKKMAWLLSVNAKTIGRYESGKITQSHQIDRLYQLFDIYPEAVSIFLKDTPSFTLFKRPLSVKSEVGFISSEKGFISTKKVGSTIANNEEDFLATSSI